MAVRIDSILSYPTHSSCAESAPQPAPADEVREPAAPGRGWRRCGGPALIFLAAILALLPAVLTVLEHDLVAMRDNDEWGTQKLCMTPVGDWGLFSIVPQGLFLGYGEPFWLLIGVPTMFFGALEWPSAAIVASRLGSLLPFAAALALVWWSARGAGVPRLPRVLLVLLIGLMPSLVANSIRVHPETLLFAAMTATVALLLRDDGRLGKWWWAAVAACGVAFAVKASTYTLGFVVLLYWLWQMYLRRDWRLAVRTGLGAAVLVPAVFFVCNFSLFIDDNFAKYRGWLRNSLLSNSSNNGEGIEGLGWRTWVETSGTYFLWPPWAYVLAAAGAAAAVLELRNRSPRPYALLGLLGWVGTFAITALLIKKGSWWHHYLIPAFAFFPWVVIGIYAALREHGRKPLVQGIAAVCLVAFTVTQVRAATNIWFRHVTFEHEVGYQLAKTNHATLKQYLRGLPGPTVRVLKNWDLPAPTSTADGRPVTLAYVPSESWDFVEHFQRNQPDLIVLYGWPVLSPWLGSTAESEAKFKTHPNLARIQESERLFQKALSEPVQVGTTRVRLERVLPEMQWWVVFRVHRF